MNGADVVLEHSIDANVTPDFAWQFWTNDANWDDPPARFAIDGPFADGSRGTTTFPDQEPLHWFVRDVQPGRSATIEMALDRASVAFEWHFDPRADGQTRLTQRVRLSGENASAYVEQLRAAFGPNMAAGMARLAALMVAAWRRGVTT